MNKDRLEKKKQIYTFQIKLMQDRDFVDVLKDLNEMFEHQNQDGLYIKYSLCFGKNYCYECAGSYDDFVYMMGHYIETDEEYDKRIIKKKKQEEINKKKREQRKKKREKEKQKEIAQAMKILEKEGYKVEEK